MPALFWMKNTGSPEVTAETTAINKTKGSVTKKMIKETEKSNICFKKE